MNKHFHKFYAVIVSVMFIIIVCNFFSMLNSHNNTDKYLSCLYGKYYYENGEEHGNCEYKIYYETLNECELNLK